jgi:uncharacterized protein (TIGR02246 family)
MTQLRNLSAALSCILLLLVGCAPKQADTRAEDEAAIRAINPTWFKMYNAGDANGVAALYAYDAIVFAPGAAAAHGQSAIREYFTKEIASMTSAGMTLVSGPPATVHVSGDVGWEAGTFSVKDKAGANVDAGKYVTVFGRKNGTWQIVADTWNSDAPMQPAK